MRICFIGDSFITGAGDDDCLGWAGRLGVESRANGHDVTVYNLGIRGDTSADIAARWEHEARARLRPEHDGRLVFSFGVNDCTHEAGQPRVSEAASLANTRTMLARAKAWRPTLMVGPPCTADAAQDERVQRLSDKMAAACDDVGVPFLPLFATLRGHPVWRRDAERGDGIHPNRDGYSLIYDAVRAWPAWREWAPPPDRSL